MKQRPRIYYTEAQRALMWDRWQKGDSMHAIGLDQRIFGDGMVPIEFLRPTAALATGFHLLLKDRKGKACSCVQATD
jgi:hypothetical protein